MQRLLRGDIVHFDHLCDALAALENGDGAGRAVVLCSRDQRRHQVGVAANCNEDVRCVKNVLLLRHIARDGRQQPDIRARVAPADIFRIWCCLWLQVPDAAAVKPYGLVVDLAEQLIADREIVRALLPVLAVGLQRLIGWRCNHKPDTSLRHDLLHRRQIVHAGGKMQDTFRLDRLHHPAAVIGVQSDEMPLRANGIGVGCDPVHTQGVLLPVKLQHRLELVGKIFDIGVVEKCAAEAPHDATCRIDEDIGRGIFEPSQL